MEELLTAAGSAPVLQLDLQPDPLPLPAPAWLLQGLLLLGFLLHVLAMNVALGGSVLAAASAARAGRDERHRRLARTLGGWLPPAFALTVTFGVVPLLFLQALHGHLFYTSSVLVAVPWLAVVAVVIGAYYLAYVHDLRFERLRPGGRLAVLLTVAVLLLAVAAIYVSNLTLMHVPAAFPAAYAASPAGLRLWFDDPMAPPRYLHMVFGALGTAALAVAWYGDRVRRRADAARTAPAAAPARDDAAWGAWCKRRAIHWFLVTLVVEIVVGLWFVVALPRETLLSFMGRDPLNTALFAGSLLLAFGMVGHAALAASRSLAPLLGMYLVTLVVMVVLRDRVRGSVLGPSGLFVTGDSAPQWGLVALFGVVFLGGVILVVWLLRRVAREWGPAPAP